MPKLTYHDVFLPQKEDVMDYIENIQKQIKGLTIVLVKLMVEAGTREVVVNRDAFAKQMKDEGIEEPLYIAFQGNGESLTAKMGIEP